MQGPWLQRSLTYATATIYEKKNYKGSEVGGLAKVLKFI